MYKLTMARQIEVPPHKAEALLQMNTFAGQRPKSPRTVDCYASLMKDGRFRVAEIAVVEMPNGTRYLMNGQQTCQAGIISQVTFKASYQEYSCETDQDLWQLYGSFDTYRGRTEANIMLAARGLFQNAELHEIPVRVLQQSAAALLYLGNDRLPRFNERTLTKTDKANLADQHKDEVLLINQYTAVASISLKVAVVAALLATFRKNPDKARPFWDRVLIGDHLERGTPQYHLHRFLASPGASVNGGLKGHTIRYKTCIAWWNSFIDGGTRKTVKVEAMKTLPEVKG